MDGYAVKAAEITKLPTTLHVVGEILAGEAKTFADTSLAAVRVMTGSLIPAGFDAVVRQEDTDYGEKKVQILRPVQALQNFCAIGEDVALGGKILTQYTKIGPLEIGILASLGIAEIPVLRPFRVGLIATGSELTAPGHPLAPGHIYETNLNVLTAKLASYPVEIVFHTIFSDDPIAICSELDRRLPHVDFILSTGGVSVGKKDILHDVVAQPFVEQLFWKVALQPGTPVMMSLYRGLPFLSLSGNPYASLTTFELFFRPIIGQFFQSKDYEMRLKKAILQVDFYKKAYKRRFVRGLYADGQVTLPTKHQSSVLSSMLGCNCFVDIPAGTMGLLKNSEVDVVLF
jgi:molybdopterin molybdotransferase